LDKIYLKLTVAEFIFRMLGNVFIALLNCSEWIKIQKFPLADFILTCLAVSRIIYLLVELFDACMIEVSPYAYRFCKLTKSIIALCGVSDHFTYWLWTCLSIFLFQIAHFSHPLFLWLKLRMNRAILVLLIFSLFLLIFDFLSLASFTAITYNILIDKSNFILYSSDVKNLSLINLTQVIPSVLSLFSLLLLYLLMRHTRNLELSSTDSGDFSTAAMKRAMKSFVFPLPLHNSIFFSVQVTYWIFLMFQKKELI
ncbi:LOW QUALITY PROTEIN: taste receptor type 2 member 42, partial [Erethizon dorsatum]